MQELFPPEFGISDVVIRTVVFGNSNLEVENFQRGIENVRTLRQLNVLACPWKWYK